MPTYSSELREFRKQHRAAMLRAHELHNYWCDQFEAAESATQRVAALLEIQRIERGVDESILRYEITESLYREGF